MIKRMQSAVPDSRCTASKARPWRQRAGQGLSQHLGQSISSYAELGLRLRSTAGGREGGVQSQEGVPEEVCIRWARAGPAGPPPPQSHPAAACPRPASLAPGSAAAFRLTSLCLEFAAAAADALAANFTGSGLGSVRRMESRRRRRVGVGVRNKQ